MVDRDLSETRFIANHAQLERSEIVSAVMGASQPQTAMGPTVRLRFPELKTEPEVHQQPQDGSRRV